MPVRAIKEENERLKAEIERLNKTNKTLCDRNAELHFDINKTAHDMTAEIERLKAENANLTVENEVLQSEKENLMRTLEEGGEEIESARKETAKEILQEFWKIKWGQSELDNVCIRLAEKYGVEVEE